MGKIAQACSVSSRKDNQHGSCEAQHHVGVSPQEDRSSAAGTVGEGEGGQEGCLEPAEPASVSAWLASTFFERICSARNPDGPRRSDTPND